MSVTYSSKGLTFANLTAKNENPRKPNGDNGNKDISYEQLFDKQQFVYMLYKAYFLLCRLLKCILYRLVKTLQITVVSNSIKLPGPFLNQLHNSISMQLTMLAYI